MSLPQISTTPASGRTVFFSRLGRPGPRNASLVGGLLAIGLAANEDRMPKRVTAWLLLTLLNGIAFVGVFSNWPSA